MKKTLFVLLFIGLSIQLVAQNMQIGTTTALWKEPSTEDFIEAKRNGIKYAEIALNQCYRNVPEDEVIPKMHALKDKIDSSGLKVWSIHLPFSKTLDISVLDDSIREKNIEFIAEMIQVSSIFKPSKLVLHSSSEPIVDSVRERRLQKAIQSIGILRKYADEIGAQLCIENLPRTCLGNTPEELLRIIEDYAEVGICFDTNHYLKGTPIHFAQTAGHRIATLHISDYDGINESHWIPGEGIIPWKELFNIIQSKGYSGIYIHEALKTKNGERATSKQLAERFTLINSYDEN